MRRERVGCCGLVLVEKQVGEDTRAEWGPGAEAPEAWSMNEASLQRQFLQKPLGHWISHLGGAACIADPPGSVVLGPGPGDRQL